MNDLAARTPDANAGDAAELKRLRGPYVHPLVTCVTLVSYRR